MQAGKIISTPNMGVLAAIVATAGSLYAEAAIAASCTVTAPTLNFGSYDPLSATPTDSSTNLQVSCSRTVTSGSESVVYVLSLSSGTGTFASRTLLRGSTPLNYNLYTSTLRNTSTIWGDGTRGSTTVSGSLPILNDGFPTRIASHTIYGRISARQDIPIGSYRGSVILTMTF